MGLNILFVSTTIPPYKESHSIRNLFIIRKLVSAGHYLKIVTPQYKDGDKSLLEKMPEEVCYVFTSLPILENIYPRIKNPYLLRGISGVVNKFVIPDRDFLWDMQVKRVLKNKSEILKNCDVVITSSGSFTSHFVGYWLKRRYDIKWIADYGDPWSVKPEGGVKKFQSKIERKLLMECDAISMTTQETIEVYKKYYNIPSNKFFLVPNGYDEILLEKAIKENYSKKEIEKDEIKCGYIGQAFYSSRNLIPFIESIRNLPVTFEIVGNSSLKFREYILTNKIKNVKITGYMEYKYALEKFLEFDFLVLIGNKGNLQIPAKVYNYLASLKPILYISQNPQDDPTQRLLKEFEGVVYTDNKLENIKVQTNYILRNIDVLRNEAFKRKNNKKIEKYSWDFVTNDFLKIFRHIY